MSLSPELQSLLSSQWLARALSERDAHHRFRWLAQVIETTEPYFGLVDEIRSASADEGQHLDLCWQQAKRFGAETLPEYKGFQPFFAGDILCELVTLFCVMETINAALLVASRDSLQDPTLRDICHQILKDEVQHARIGWAALSIAREEERAIVWTKIPQILKAAGVHKIDKEDSIPLHEPKWGIFDRATRVAIFEQTMDSVIIPGFIQLGFQPSMSWQSMIKGIQES